MYVHTKYITWKAERDGRRRRDVRVCDTMPLRIEGSGAAGTGDELPK